MAPQERELPGTRTTKGDFMATTKGSALAHPSLAPEDRWRAIKERSTRGLLSYNGGVVLHLEGEAWAVRSSRGGYHRVDLDAETCTCEDFTHYGRAHDMNCRHIFAAAIGHATRRGQRLCACLDGWVYLGVEEDGVEHIEAMPCRRCRRSQ
jgi:hypothetical protein